MPDHPPQPSFSPRRKWSIGFHVTLATLVVLAIVVMVNYLSGRYFWRAYLSTDTRVKLSSRTLNLVHSLTNRVRVTLYYDSQSPFYGDIADLLREYSSANRRISVRSVDYLRDPGAAQEIKTHYKLFSPGDTNLIIFDCQGRSKIVAGNALVDYDIERASGGDDQAAWRRRPTQFRGEMMFSGALLAVCNPKPLNAYMLQGHGEHRPNDAGPTGYLTFASILEGQNYVRVHPLSLLGTNRVPADCNLLIIAGPTTAIPDIELDKIENYLTNRNGKLLALFNARTVTRPTGLEKILAKWGIIVADQLVLDPEHMAQDQDIVISAFAQHPLVSPILGSGLYMLLPRAILTVKPSVPNPDAPKTEPVAFSGEHSYLYSESERTPRKYVPVMAIADKTAVQGIASNRGVTRMIVAGDSYFFDNQLIDRLSNRDFASIAINWLLDRTQLLEGIGPRPISEYRLELTRQQLQALEWIFLAGLPGAILLLGGLVWLRRRN